MEPLALLAVFSGCYIVSRLLSGQMRTVGASVTIVELALGIVIGNWLIPLDAAKAAGGISEIGALALFFLVGLHTGLKEVRVFRRDVAFVTMIGATASLLAVFALYRPFGLTGMEVLFAAATVMATGVGVVMRVLQEYDGATTRSGKLLLACSAVEDIPAILLLSVAASAGHGGFTGAAVGSIALKTLVAALCVVAASFAIATKRIPPIPLPLVLPAVILAAWVTSALGFTSLLGAYLVGAACRDHAGKAYESYMRPVIDFCVPIFFVMVGMRVKIETLMQPESWMLASGLVAVAFGSKLLCYAGIQERSRAKGIDPWIVTFGMIPRGLPGLAFATAALGSGMIRDSVFSALIIMVTVTNFAGLTLLSWRLKHRQPVPDRPAAVPDGE